MEWPATRISRAAGEWLMAVRDAQALLARGALALAAVLLLGATSPDAPTLYTGQQRQSRIDSEALRVRAGQGDAAAETELGRAYLASGPSRDVEQAMVWFSRAIEHGSLPARAEAALLLLRGDGVPRDPERALALLQPAAEAGDALAEATLGVIYARGDGVQPDLREAALWYQKAADLGNVQAQFFTGRFYATGTGVSPNMKEAARWFMKAAEQGHETAAYNAAVFHSNQIVDVLKQYDIKTADKVLSGIEKDGITAAAPTESLIDAAKIIWETIESFDMTNTMKFPLLKTFVKNMDAGSQVLGRYEKETVYVNKELADGGISTELVTTTLEEMCHHITQAGDMSRDLQDFAFRLASRLILKMSLEKKKECLV